MLSQKAKSLKPSPTLALNAKAKALKAQGKDIISLSVGEPDWNSYEAVNEVGIAAIRAGKTKYAPAQGIPELQNEIVKNLTSSLAIPFTTAQVSITTGAKFSLFSAMQCSLDPGDEVIIPTPYWVSYPVMVGLTGAKPVIVNCPSFKITAELLEQAITPRTKLLLLNSPSNPTGLVYSKEELKSLADVLKKHSHVYVITDDIYNQLVFDGLQRAPHILQAAPELKDRVLIVDGASKVLSMTGWRVGWAVGPKEWIQAMNDYQSQTVSCAATFSQLAAAEGLKSCRDEIRKSVALLQKRRDLALQKLKEMPLLDVAVPQGAFYFWIGISKAFNKSYQGTKIQNSAMFCELLLQEGLVAAVPGAEFGVEGYMRISFAVDESQIQIALERISQFLQKLS